VLTEAADLAVVTGRGSRLEDGTLTEPDLTGAKLVEGRLADVVFDGGSLANATANRTEVRRVVFASCRATGASFAEARLTDVLFDSCRLDLASFRFARLERVAFRDCRLEEADFYGAGLVSVLFERSPLVAATFTEATLERVELRGCELTGLHGAERMRGARMPWPDVVGAAETFAAAIGIEIVD
jgi:uncharacterized protein YjbI with pentapeptide repeats